MSRSAEILGVACNEALLQQWLINALATVFITKSKLYVDYQSCRTLFHPPYLLFLLPSTWCFAHAVFSLAFEHTTEYYPHLKPLYIKFFLPRNLFSQILHGWLFLACSSVSSQLSPSSSKQSLYFLLTVYCNLLKTSACWNHVLKNYVVLFIDSFPLLICKNHGTSDIDMSNFYSQYL